LVSFPASQDPVSIKDNSIAAPLQKSSYQYLLIDQKAEVNARDIENNMLLHILGQNSIWLAKTERGCQSCFIAAEELMKAGADLTAVNNEGETPMENVFVKDLREPKPELFLEKSVCKPTKRFQKI
jgi:hypothetical protein